MKLIQIISSIFNQGSTLSTSTLFHKEQRDRALSVVRRFSRGGVALQSGNILTQEEFDIELEELKKKVENQDYDYQ